MAPSQATLTKPDELRAVVRADPAGRVPAQHLRVHQRVVRPGVRHQPVERGPVDRLAGPVVDRHRAEPASDLRPAPPNDLDRRPSRRDRRAVAGSREARTRLGHQRTPSYAEGCAARTAVDLGPDRRPARAVPGRRRRVRAAPRAGAEPVRRTRSAPTGPTWSGCSTTPPGWAARDLDRLDVQVLRSWLARLRSTGAARTTLARRAAAARTFTAWAHRTGLLAADPGARLASPRPHRTLPPVLREDQAVALVERPDPDDGPLGLRDRLVLELLYATGIRVGELVGLDVDDVDRHRRVVRVLGKGDKERSVPFGVPAERALDAWLRRGRPALAGAGSGPALVLGRQGRRVDPRTVRRIVHEQLAGAAGRARPRAARAAALRRHPPAGGRRRPARGAGDPRPRQPVDHPDLHPRLGRAAAGRLPAGPSPGLSRARR